MTAPWMPPLPEPIDYGYRDGETWVSQFAFAADQMRQAQADAARAALEQAAKVCKKLPREAAAIRALIDDVERSKQ